MTKRRCGGYAVHCNQTPLSPSNSDPHDLIRELPSDSRTDALEKRTFEFFRHRTLPCLSGYFPDAMWDGVVLQLSYSEPVVRYALAALGALHEQQSLRRADGERRVNHDLVQTDFPVRLYSKALHGLQEMIPRKTTTTNLLLVCALLFVHFEALHEDFTPALMHAENAIRLIHTSSASGTEIDSTLVNAMQQIDLKSSLYLNQRVPELFLSRVIHSDIPVAFVDLLHARDVINAWSYRLFHFIRSVADHYKLYYPGDVPLEHLAYAQSLERNLLTLEALLWDLTKRPNLKISCREHNGLSILRIRLKVNRILACGCLYAETAVYDRFLPDFDSILNISKCVLSSDTVAEQLFSFSSDEGLLHPLYFVAVFCRDSRTRHDALTQLHRLPAHRGVWHVEVMTKMAAMAIEIEEEGLEAPRCEDLPEWKRIHAAEFDGADVAAKLQRDFGVLWKSRPNGLDGEWSARRMIIKW
jgi:hypothetical protein